MIYDTKARKTLPGTVDTVMGGCGSFMSWDRLVRRLREVQEFRDNETVTHLKIMDDGIEFRIEMK